MTIKKQQPIIKNKKISQRGFTLIEILAAITILGILTAIAVVSVTKIIENGKEKHYTTAEENISLAGQSYVQQNRGYLPKAIGQKKKVTLKTLVDKNYIATIKDYSGNECDSSKSYVQIYKYSQSDYSYVAYLDCPNYTSKDKLKDITPKIEAVIDENEDARTAHARIKITGNEKIVSYSYILYRNNKQIKNTGNIQEKEMPETRNINFSLEDYTPGNIKLVVTATNTYGNTKTVTVTKNIPDQKNPICIIKEEDKADSPKTWIKDRNGERKITVGCDDGETGSGCTRKEFSKTFKTSMRTGIITIEDESGNKTNCEVSVYIDKVNPTITVNAYKRDASGKKTGSILSTTTSSNSETLDLTSLSSTEWLNKAEYPNGIYYEIKLNDNLEVATYNLKGNATGLTKNHSAVDTITRSIENSSLSTTSKTKNFSITTDGYNKTKVEISDAAGNSANVTMITPVDTTAPTVPNISMYKWAKNSTEPESSSGLSDYSNNTWSNKNIYTVASGSTDEMSGFKEYQYTTTGKTTNDEDKAATTRNIKKEGTSYIKYRACDNAGNCSEYSTNYTLKIDKTNPKCTNSGDSETWTNGDRTIYWGCSDATSGCNPSYSGSSKIFSFTKQTSLIEEYTIKDNAGNSVSCAERTANVYVDKTAPTCSNRGDSTTWTKKDRTIHWGCIDSHSGCNSSFSGDSTTYSSTTWTATIGAYTIKDNAGNSVSCAERTANVYVDKTAPTVSKITNPTSGNASLGNFSLTVYGSDEQSGISHWQYSYDNASWTTYASSNYSPFTTTKFTGKRNQNVYIRVCDNAGNCSNPKSSKIHIVDACDSGYTTIGSYGNWGSCSAACGPGKKYRDVYLVSTFDNSISCGKRSTQEEADCNVAPCECSHEYGTYGSAPGNYENYYYFTVQEAKEYSNCEHSYGANGPNGEHSISVGQVIKKIQCKKCGHKTNLIWCPCKYGSGEC